MTDETDTLTGYLFFYFAGVSYETKALRIARFVV